MNLFFTFKFRNCLVLFGAPVGPENLLKLVYNARAQPLYYSLNLLRGDVLATVFDAILRVGKAVRNYSVRMGIGWQIAFFKYRILHNL